MLPIPPQIEARVRYLQQKVEPVLNRLLIIPVIATIVRTAHEARDRARHLRQTAEPIVNRFLKIPAIALIVRTTHEMSDDDATHMAAGVAYYAILSMVPLMVGLIALLGMFLKSESVQAELFDFFRIYLPASTDELEANIEGISELRGALGILSILGLFWTASAIFGAITRAVNRAWDVHRDRPFYIAKLRNMGMAMGVGLLFILSVSLTGAIQTLGGMDLPGVGRLTFLENDGLKIITRVLPFLFSLSIFMLIYKYLPNTVIHWKYVWPGALLAAVSFEIIKSTFVFYLDNFANYEKVYGSLGSVVALLVWIYISSLILIIGAEFSSEYGRMREGLARGSAP